MLLDVDQRDVKVLLDRRPVDPASPADQMGKLLLNVAPGSHELSVRKTGFQTFHQNIATEPGQRLVVSIRLAAEIAPPPVAEPSVRQPETEPGTSKQKLAQATPPTPVR